MKYFFPGFAVIILLMFGLTGCDTNAPKPVAEKFLLSFWHLDYKEAKKVSTQHTKDMLDMLDEMSENIPASRKAESAKIKVSIKKVDANDTAAIVTFVTSEIKEEQQLKLVKQNGQWLVNLTKNDNFGIKDEAEMPAEDAATDNTDTTGM